LSGVAGGATGGGSGNGTGLTLFVGAPVAGVLESTCWSSASEGRSVRLCAAPLPAGSSLTAWMRALRVCAGLSLVGAARCTRASGVNDGPAEWFRTISPLRALGLVVTACTA
jgi:hypothetical protein